MLIKSYNFNKINFTSPFLLSSLFQLSKEMENYKNKDLYGNSYPIVLVEQSRRFYSLNYTSTIFLRFTKFGHKNALKYSIFKFKLFDKKELSDLFIAEDFLIKNIEFTRYFLFCKKIKNIYLKKLIRSVFFKTSWKLKLKLLTKVRWAPKKKKKLRRRRKFILRKKFSYLLNKKKRKHKSKKKRKKIVLKKKYNYVVAFLLKNQKRKWRKTLRGILKKRSFLRKKEYSKKKRLLIKKKYIGWYLSKLKLYGARGLKKYHRRFRKSYISNYFFDNRRNKHYFKLTIKNKHYSKQWFNRKKKKNFFITSRYKRYYMNFRPGYFLDFISPVLGNLRKLSKEKASLYRIDWKKKKKKKFIY